MDVRRGLAVAAVLLAGCSSTKSLSSTAKATNASTTTTTHVTTSTTSTTVAPTTTTVYDSPNLQDHLVSPPTGYTYAADLGNSSNPDSPGGGSGDIPSADFNTSMGIPNASDTLHFQQGYDQFYHYDASQPNSLVRALEIDLFEFDGPNDATTFMGQSVDHIISGTATKKVSTTVGGAPALVADAVTKDPAGNYDHLVTIAHDNRVEQVFYYDTAPGPSSFLMTIAAQQLAKI